MMSGGISQTRWKAVHRLLHARGRAKSGQILVEGSKAVKTVLERSPGPEFLLAGPSPSTQARKLLAVAEVGRIPVYELSGEQTEQLSTTTHSQELFAVLTWQPQSGCPDSCPDLLMHLSGIRNPTNMGSLLRSAAAFHVHTTCSPDCVDVTHPIAVRSGAATYFNTPLFCDVQLADLRARCPGHATAYASSGGGTALTEFDWPPKSILVVGGEAEGATESIGDALQLNIPSTIESLNAAVAAGILLWEAHRQGVIAS